LHGRAIEQLESRLYDGMPPVSVAALPFSFNPFHWNGVVETARAYEVVPVDALGQLDTEGARIFYKPAPTRAIESAQAEPAFRYFRYFARFPVWSEQPVMLEQEEGRRVELTDLRFGEPGAGAFHSIALEDRSSRVLRSWFTFGSGRD
jgi:hypothetical protein